jgi:hypothetical protein
MKNSIKMLLGFIALIFIIVIFVLLSSPPSYNNQDKMSQGQIMPQVEMPQRPIAFLPKYKRTLREYLMGQCPKIPNSDKINAQPNTTTTYEDWLFSECKKHGTCDGPLNDADPVSLHILNNKVNCGAWSKHPNGNFRYNNDRKWYT